MHPALPSMDEASEIFLALLKPIASAPLQHIAHTKHQPTATAVIVVSDNTRPVPYSGEAGILNPIIDDLLKAGWQQAQITILIGAGSHRNMSADEIEEMLGLKDMGYQNIHVLNHEYDKEEQLVYLGETKRGSLVKINKQYMEADLKIVTGLVEAHFMAGASGGRKGICPGIVGKETLSIFHGAKLLNSDKAADLVLEGNPLHEEALEVALMAGCDFLVNVTLDKDFQINGIFAGDLQKAHEAAVEFIRGYVTVELEQRYDIVHIPAGYVGINHYQAGKAAVEASKAVKRGGWIIITAQNTDVDPIGGVGYKQCLALLHKHGQERFMEMISAPDWEMIQEQWQVQMWCKVLDVIGGPEHLIYCALEIPRENYTDLPGLVGLDFLTKEEKSDLPAERLVELMATRAIAHAKQEIGDPNASFIYLKDGPYGIPIVKGE